MDTRDEVITRAIGEALRLARVAAGYSRDDVVARMNAEIEPRTLASYEHGSRQLTVVRLADVCGTLGTPAQNLLGIALQRAEVDLDNVCLQVDLDALSRVREDELTPLRTWARRHLDHNPDSHVATLKGDVITEMAIFFEYPRFQLVRHLMMFTPLAVSHL